MLLCAQLCLEVMELGLLLSYLRHQGRAGSTSKCRQGTHAWPGTPVGILQLFAQRGRGQQARTLADSMPLAQGRERQRWTLSKPSTHPRVLCELLLLFLLESLPLSCQGLLPCLYLLLSKLKGLCACMSTAQAMTAMQCGSVCNVHVQNVGWWHINTHLAKHVLRLPLILRMGICPVQDRHSTGAGKLSPMLISGDIPSAMGTLKPHSGSN